jgi:hypothetical protein
LIGLFLAETSPPALFEKRTFADFFRDQFAGHAIADDIPMTVADVFIEPVQVNLIVFGKLLQLGRKSYQGNVFALTKRANAVVGIKQIGNTQPLL